MTSPRPEPGILTISLRTAAILLLFTLSFTLLMAATYTATKDTIAASAEEEKLSLIGEVLPPALYDNLLLQDFVTLPPTPALGLAQPTRAYRARKNGQPVALVFEATAPDGYSGNIQLILAVRNGENQAGEVVAVRVTQHKETPGLGDYIELKKDRNKEHPWIRQFDQLGFAQLPAEQWKVNKDGGHFLQRSGATISARAVTNAVTRALTWANQHGQPLFAAGPTPAASTPASGAPSADKP